MKPLPLITLLPLLALTACDNTTNPNPPSQPTISSPAPAGEASAFPQPEGAFPSFAIQTNLLQNPSIENLSEETNAPTPWHDLSDRSPTWHPLTVSTQEAHTGTHSAKLTINKQISTQDNPAAILGIVQSIKPKTHTLPTTIEGHYKVTDWTRDTKDQYLQAVIMCARPANKPPNSNYPTYQLAIPLAGITEPPFKIGNRKFAFDPHNTPPQDPILNEWVHFKFNLHELYQHHWGFIPENSTEYKVFFEVRYDNKQPDQHPTATVYYDDLYLGTPE